MQRPLTVMNLRQAERHKRKFGAVITIEDPTLRRSHQMRFNKTPHPHHLVLEFDDVDEPRHPWRHAEEADVLRGLEFAREHRALSIMVHCFAGLGRSPAMALAILADRLRHPDVALADLLEMCPLAVPNLMVVGHADTILGFKGELLKLVSSWDSGQARNVRRRQLNIATADLIAKGA